MTFRRFEDIEAWKTARLLARELYKVTTPRELDHDYSLRDQIRRAAISVMANIAEGSTYRTDREFARFLIIARGSATEIQSHLYVVLDQGYFDDDRFAQLNRLVEKCSKQLANLISFLLGRRKERTT